MAVGDRKQVFRLNQASILQLTRGDITHFQGDAIVNAGSLPTLAPTPLGAPPPALFCSWA